MDATPSGTRLPADWWRKERVCRILSNCFDRHLLAVNVVMKQRGKTHGLVYTGFGLLWNDQLWWMTAGHVIKKLQAMMNDPTVDIEACTIIAGNHAAGDASLPVALNDLRMYAEDDGGFDFGIASIRPGYASPLLADTTFEPVNPHIWRGNESAKPVGFYLVGFPCDWTTFEANPAGERQMQGQTNFGVCVLPVKRIADQGMAANAPGDAFWGHKTAFYGHVLRFDGPSPTVVGDLRGTSGGPIFSIEPTSDGAAKYRLFGIQSGCLASQQIIRATSIADVAHLLDTAERDEGRTRSG